MFLLYSLLQYVCFKRQVAMQETIPYKNQFFVSFFLTISQNKLNPNSSKYRQDSTVYHQPITTLFCNLFHKKVDIAQCMKYNRFPSVNHHSF